MNRPLRVTIIGAGIGGLSAAIALRDIGAEVSVLERAPELRPVGAGICMWPNGAQALNRLGIVDALEDVSPILHRLCYRSSDGSLLREMSVERLTERTGQRSYPLARSDLHLALLSRLDTDTVRLGTACVDVQQDDAGVRVMLEDGSVIESDLLVGADGVRSVVRDHVTGGDHHLRYHYSTWVGLVPQALDLTPVDTFTLHVQDAKRVGLLSVGAGRIYFFCDTVPGNDKDNVGARAELMRQFAGWCPSVQTLLENIDDETTHRLPVCDLDPLESFVRGRIVLLGDAAHATTPTLGQGAALAMEDSLVLAQCLATSSDHAVALATYDAARLERTRAVVLASRARTETLLGHNQTSAQRWQEELSSMENQDFLDELAKIHRAGPLAVAV